MVIDPKLTNDFLTADPDTRTAIMKEMGAELGAVAGRYARLLLLNGVTVLRSAHPAASSVILRDNVDPYDDDGYMSIHAIKVGDRYVTPARVNAIAEAESEIGQALTRNGEAGTNRFDVVKPWTPENPAAYGSDEFYEIVLADVDGLKPAPAPPNYNALTNEATFESGGQFNTWPTITIGGVSVTTYITSTGLLRVLIDTHNADQELPTGQDGTARTEVRYNNEIVYQNDRPA